MKPKSLEEVKKQMMKVSKEEAAELLDQWETSLAFQGFTNCLQDEGYTPEVAAAADAHFDKFLNAVGCTAAQMEISISVGHHTYVIERPSDVFDLADNAMADDEEADVGD